MQLKVTPSYSGKSRCRAVESHAVVQSQVTALYSGKSCHSADRIPERECPAFHRNGWLYREVRRVPVVVTIVLTVDKTALALFM